MAPESVISAQTLLGRPEKFGMRRPKHWWGAKMFGTVRPNHRGKGGKETWNSGVQTLVVEGWRSLGRGVPNVVQGHISLERGVLEQARKTMLFRLFRLWSRGVAPKGDS